MGIWAIIVMVAVFGIFPIYIGAGIAVKVKMQGENLDVEAIPQISFWRELPKLVVDGFVFTGQEMYHGSRAVSSELHL